MKALGRWAVFGGLALLVAVAFVDQWVLTAIRWVSLLAIPLVLIAVVRLVGLPKPSYFLPPKGPNPSNPPPPSDEASP